MQSNPLCAALNIINSVLIRQFFLKKKKKSQRQTPKAVLPTSQDLKAKSFQNIAKPPSGLLR